MDTNLEKFIEGYIECALWSESANTTETDDRSIGDVASMAGQTFVIMSKEAAEFYEANRGQLTEAACHREWSHLGHDFWLNRNGHGTGFWDRGLPGTLGETLSDASHKVGGRDLYIGDDGQIYQS